MLRHVRTTIVTGIIAFLPVFVLVYVGIHTFGVLNGALTPLIDKLYIDQRYGALVLFVMSVLGVLLIIYGLGLIARFGFIAGALVNIERGIGKRVPAYGFIKSVVTGVIDESDTDGFVPVEVAMPTGAQIAFLVDELPDGRVVVFVPDVPNPRSGDAIIIDRERCKPIDLPAHRVIEVLTFFGKGLGGGAAK